MSQSRDRNLKHKYGITEAEYDGMIAAQRNRCQICRQPFQPERPHNPHVDHCHETGQVRGILCQMCNHGLGNFRDNPALLAKAIEYL